MPLETTITIPPNLGKALAALKPEALRVAVAKGMVRGTALIVGRIQRDRLSGQGPFALALKKLGVITGRARQSVRASATATITGDTVQTSIGSVVSYLQAHEFGFKGRVNVASFTRQAVKLGRLNRAGQLSKKSASKLKGALQRRGSNAVTVRAHKRKVNIPERAPLRTGINENLPVLYREIQRELTTDMNRAKS